jgi:DNA-binding PadR family transcriptional regulator
VVSSTRVAQSVKPDRVVYSLTAAGLAELSQWMGTPSPRTSGFRDDFFLTVMAATRSGDPEVVGSVLDVQRTNLLQELRNLESLRREPERSAMVKLLLSAAARHVGADLAFLDDVESSLPSLLSDARERPAGAFSASQEAA